MRNSDVFRHQRAPACHEARSSSALARLHARHGTCVSCPVQQASEGISMERELFSIEQSARGWVVYPANGGNEPPDPTPLGALGPAEQLATAPHRRQTERSGAG